MACVQSFHKRQQRQDKRSHRPFCRVRRHGLSRSLRQLAGRRTHDSTVSFHVTTYHGVSARGMSRERPRRNDIDRCEHVHPTYIIHDIYQSCPYFLDNLVVMWSIQACTKKTLWKYWLAAPDSGIKSLESPNSTPSPPPQKKNDVVLPSCMRISWNSGTNYREKN